jgi:hypothetical protein
MSDARNIRQYQFDEYEATLVEEERWTFQSFVAAMKLPLLRTLAPKRVTRLGELLEWGAKVWERISPECVTGTVLGWYCPVPHKS